MASFAGRLLTHLRFTLHEFRVNWRAGMGLAASRFFVMRLLSPFGVGRSWQESNASPDTHVQDLCSTAFSELDRRPSAETQHLTAHFLTRMAAQCGQEFASLQDYFEYCRSQRVQRPAGVIATGRADCPISTILRHPDLVRLVETYLGLPANRVAAFANIDALIRLDQHPIQSGYDNALNLHRDIDGYRFLKVFVYLTECRRGEGHHEVYLRSHRHYPWRLGPIARYDAEAVVASIPAAQLKQVEGPAGYTFAENTFAFHRGTVPQSGDRLICNLIYVEDTFMKLHPSSFRLAV